jgi:hypothetical protein
MKYRTSGEEWATRVLTSAMEGNLNAGEPGIRRRPRLRDSILEPSNQRSTGTGTVAKEVQISY